MEDVQVDVLAQTGRTNMDGAVRLEVPAGAYPLRFSFGSDTFSPGNPDAPVRSLETLPVKVVDGETTEVIATFSSDGHLVNLLVEVPNADAMAAARPVSLEGPKGTIEGVVRADQTGAFVQDAYIFVRGAALEVKTDAQGRFRLSLPQGQWFLSVVHPRYATDAARPVSVEAEATTSLEVRLLSSEVELDDFVVSTPRLQGGVVAVTHERRETTEVADVLGAEAMKKAGDSDAAGALKRVAGLTVVGGKYVYVRGLGERYSSVLLDGSFLPSPDPSRRVIPLDLFPIDILESVVVQKTYSPDLPGDFSGGLVLLRTRGVPEAFFFNASLTLGGNSQSTFREGLGYQGGSLDRLGIDDGTRAWPRLVQEATNGGQDDIGRVSPDELRDAVWRSFPNVWDARPFTMGPDYGVDVSVGSRLAARGSTVIGYRLYAGYDTNTRFRNELRKTFSLQPGGLQVLDTTDLSWTAKNVSLTSMGALSAEFGRNHKIGAFAMITRRTQDSVLFREVDNVGEQRIERWTMLEWLEREMASAQLRGEHKVGGEKGLGVDWAVAYSRAAQALPDRRETKYARLERAQNDPFALSFGTATGGRPAVRSYEEFTEDAFSYGLNLVAPLRLGSQVEGRAKLGASRSEAKREVRINRYNYVITNFFGLSPDILERTSNPSVEANLVPGALGRGRWEIVDGGLNVDNYDGFYDVTGLYLAGELDLGKRVKAQGGVRYEDASIETQTFGLRATDQRAVSRLSDTPILPALTLTWLTSDKTQVRAAYSQTVNRPQLKELSENIFVNPETRFEERGNPNLEVARIRNVDARFEYYPSVTETASVAVFYKDFDNPIEQVILGGGADSGGVRTFANVPAASNFGLELEGRHDLERWADWMEGLTAVANVSVIRSEVNLGEAIGTNTSQNRPLQGQSPWVVNAQLEYDDGEDWLSAALSFNVFGARISDVGNKGLPDIYEKPAPLLDFTSRLNFGSRGALKLSLRNLMNPTFRFEQGEGVQRAYKLGVSGSLTYALSY